MLGYTWIQWLFFFFFYSFFGWCFESTYVSLHEKRFVNRGFIRGPFLPLYGTGALMMLIVSMPFQDNLILTDVAGCVGATVLEYITGTLMWMIWRRRWWDYTGLFWNIDGYVCLRSVLTFAVGGLLLLYILEPVLRKGYDRLERKAVSIAGGSLAVLLLLDCIFSFLFRNPVG